VAVDRYDAVHEDILATVISPAKAEAQHHAVLEEPAMAA